MSDDKVNLVLRFKGGKGSGDFGHKGRKGMVGGSSGSGGSGSVAPAEDDVDADGVPNGYTTNQAKDFIKLSFRQSTQFTMNKMPKLATEAFGLALKAGKKYGISVEELSALAEEASN